MYYGRPFEARNKAKGGAFTGDEKEYLRFVLGDGSAIGAFDEAIIGMRAGGIRRIVVSPGPLFYPLDKPRSKLPRPSTFSGERALYFVLENQGACAARACLVSLPSTVIVCRYRCSLRVMRHRGLLRRHTCAGLIDKTLLFDIELIRLDDA